MARATPAPDPVETPPAPTVEPVADDTEPGPDGQQAAGEAGPTGNDASPAAPVELDPGPPSVEPAAEAEPPDGDQPEGGEPLSLDPPDPLHLIGNRPCPVCDGAGEIPFGVLQSPRFRPCEECGGVGQVLTGSLIAEASVFDCPACTGKGYREVTPATGIDPYADVVAVPTAPTAADAPPWPGATWDVSTARWV